MRAFLHLVSAAMLAVVSMPAQAQDYPNKAVHLIVPYVAGAGSDFTARVMADALGARLGQPVVVENRPGANGAIGSDYVAKAAPDGYTLLWGAADAITMLAAVKPTLTYKIDDFSYIGKFTHTGLTVAVNAKLPINSIPDLIAYAKANPGKLKYGSAGFGSGAHMATLLFSKATGINMVHVPYKGIAAAVTDLVGGHIDLALVAPPTIAPHVAAEKVRVIGITAPGRHPLVPNAPTMTEVGVPQATVVPWYAVLGPLNLPANVSEKLRKEVAAVVNDPAVQERLKKAGWVPAGLSGDELKTFVAEEYKQWKEIADAEKIVITE